MGILGSACRKTKEWNCPVEFASLDLKKVFDRIQIPFGSIATTTCAKISLRSVVALVPEPTRMHFRPGNFWHCTWCPKKVMWSAYFFSTQTWNTHYGNGNEHRKPMGFKLVPFKNWQMLGTLMTSWSMRNVWTNLWTWNCERFKNTNFDQCLSARIHWPFDTGQ